MNIDILNPNEFFERVDIRIQNRNRKKCIVTIDGLSPDLDLNKISRVLGKNLNTRASVINDNIIQLQGDHRYKVKEFLVKMKVVDENQIIIHGY